MNSKTNSYRPVLVLAPGVLAGAEKVVLTGLMALYEEGLNPLMVIIRETRVPKFAEDFQNALPTQIESVIIDSTKALDLKLPYRLKAVLQGQKLPLVLHSHGFKALIACYMIKKDRPHLHTHHGNTAHTLKVRIYEKIAAMTMKKCDMVIAVSKKMQDELIRSLAPFEDITVVENMLSLSNAKKIREERLQHNTDSTIIKLMFVGRLSPEKGLLSFLKNWFKFSENNHFHLTVLGDGPERNEAEAFVRDHQLEAQVIFHGFIKDPSNYFAAPDVLIMPSLREGLPMTLIEALASGVPVVANNVGAISSMVTHNHNGYLTSETDNWDEAFKAILKDYKTWKTHAMNEAFGIEERFSARKWALSTIALYKNALNS